MKMYKIKKSLDSIDGIDGRGGKILQNLRTHMILTVKI